MSGKTKPQYYNAQINEFPILFLAITPYFRSEERSDARKEIVSQTLKDLSKLHSPNPAPWNSAKIRQWFANNKKKYFELSEDQLAAPFSLSLKNYKLSKSLPEPQIDRYASDSKDISTIGNVNDYLNNLGFPSCTPPTSALSSYQIPEIFPNSEKKQIIDSESYTLNLPDFPSLPQFPPDMKSYSDCRRQCFSFIKDLSKSIVSFSQKNLNKQELNEKQENAENLLDQILCLMFQYHVPITSLPEQQIKCRRSSKYQMTYKSFSSDLGYIKPTEEVFEEIGPGLFYPKRFVLPFLQNLIRQHHKYLIDFINGTSWKVECRTLPCNIECCVMTSKGDLAFTYLHTQQRAYFLHYLDRDEPTGFFSQPTSMYFDEVSNLIYIAGDVRVISFDATTLAPIKRFSTQMQDSLNYSVITLFSYDNIDYLAVGTEDRIIFWKTSSSTLYSDVPTNFSRIAESQRLNAAFIDPNYGYSYEWIYEPPVKLHLVTSICFFHQYLAFASKEYHTIYLLDLETRTVTNRLVGHLCGITDLIYFKTYLISTSLDHTIRTWNLEKFVSTYQFFKHDDGVITATVGEYDDADIIFAASRDGVIQLWTTNYTVQSFEIRYDTSKPDFMPIRLKFLPEDAKLKVITRNQVFEYTFCRGG